MGKLGTGLSVLIIDDEAGIRHGLKYLFKKEGFLVHAAGDFDAAMAIARKITIDVAILDIRLKGKKDGISLLKELKNIEPDMIAIIITGFGSIDTAVSAIKKGAADYIVKPIDNRKLIDVVKRNLEIKTLKDENYYLKSQLSHQHPSHKFLTNNLKLQQMLVKADKIKDKPVTVLITGESGTGKEVFSRYIHYTSIRNKERFVGINCAALSENLLLSELFGHEKGAFTGAIDRKIGKFEQANGGTLFMDEIGDMSMNIQAKFLRVLEQRSFERLGGSKSINIDVRLIAATNQNLNQLIQKKEFRADLFFRVNVISFHLSPLRQRKEDIPLLLDHYIQKYNQRYHKKVICFTDHAISELMDHNWPGNVRELANVVNQAVLLADKDEMDIDMLEKSYPHQKEGMLCPDIPKKLSLKDKMDEICSQYEETIIKKMMGRHNNNKSQTAKALSITRKTLAQKIEKYKLTFD